MVQMTSENRLGYIRSCLTEISSRVHKGEDGSISPPRSIWIGSTLAVWLASGFAALRGSEVIADMLGQEDPAVTSIRMMGSIGAAFVATSVIDRLFLRKILTHK